MTDPVNDTQGLQLSLPASRVDNTVRMATMAQVHEKVALAVTANEAGNFSDALTYLRSAKMLLSVLPSRSAGEKHEVEINADSIDSMITEIRRAQAGSAGIRSSSVRYQNTPPSDD